MGRSMQERASPHRSASGRTSFSAIFLDIEFLRRVPYELLPIEGLRSFRPCFLLNQERTKHANDGKDTAKALGIFTIIDMHDNSCMGDHWKRRIPIVIPLFLSSGGRSFSVAFAVADLRHTIYFADYVIYCFLYMILTSPPKYLFCWYEQKSEATFSLRRSIPTMSAVRGATALPSSPVALAFAHIQWDPLGSLRLTAQETALLRMAETNPIEYTLADSRDASMYARVLLKLLAEASAAGSGNGELVNQRQIALFSA
jgi:hypothetical protein